MNLGDSLDMLGEREGETAKLGEAAAAYCEALKEATRECEFERRRESRYQCSAAV